MIKANIAGDVWLAKSLSGKTSPLTGVDLDSDLDLFICNLEAPVSSSEVRPNRRAILSTEISLLNHLNVADRNIFVLANNHMGDYGGSGLLQTIDLCKASGFSVVGAGRNLKEARSPLILNVKGRKIAILAYAETASHVGALEATSLSPGIAPLEMEIMVADIVSIRNRVDDVWVFLHWGREYQRYPMSYQRDIAKAIVSSGGALIVGHHPHVLQGMEIINGRPVCYSLGNFIFPPIPLIDDCLLYWDKLSRETAIIKHENIKGVWSTSYQYFSLDENGCPKLPNGSNLIIENRSAHFASSNYEFFRYLNELLDRIRINFNRFSNPIKLRKDLIRLAGRLYED
jgi:poly-gamma-glutamate capsule biosynthesis protein CapA/YwtB (metallophosphatase superfamily)